MTWYISKLVNDETMIAILQYLLRLWYDWWVMVYSIKWRSVISEQWCCSFNVFMQPALSPYRSRNLTVTHRTSNCATATTLWIGVLRNWVYLIWCSIKNGGVYWVFGRLCVGNWVDCPPASAGASTSVSWYKHGTILSIWTILFWARTDLFKLNYDRRAE